MGTRLIDSTPAPMATSMAPDMTAWAAKWMACWADPHWRSTVVPGTDSGKPAARAALRAMFMACSPDRHGAAHDHVLDQGGVEVVAGQQGGQRLGRQVGGVPPREAAAPAAHRGADGIDDHGVGHKERNSDAESDLVPDGGAAAGLAPPGPTLCIVLHSTAGLAERPTSG